MEADSMTHRKGFGEQKFILSKVKFPTQDLKAIGLSQ